MARDPASILRGILIPAVEAGTMARAGNRTFWAEMRGRIAEMGLDWNRQAGDIVREARTAAVARRTAYERFERARPEAVFSPYLRAPDINPRNLAVQAVQPQYLVRFDLTYIGPDGSTSTRTVTMRDVLTPGMTKQDVLDAVQEAAEGMGNDYGQGVLGVANLQPVTI